MRSKYSAIFLVLVNLYPIYGVIFLNWSVAFILYTYWFENLIIGLFTVLKMLKTKIYIDEVQSINPSLSSKYISRSNSSKIISFIFNYYFAAFVHFFLIGGVSLLENFPHQIIVSVCFIFLSHTFSYVTNFIIGNEYKNLSLEEEIKMPFRRLIVVHLTILLGYTLVFSVFNFFTGDNSAEIPVITAMVLIKIILDIVAHLKEHKEPQAVDAGTI